MGIEPTYPAWKAGTLPLSYTRKAGSRKSNLVRPLEVVGLGDFWEKLRHYHYTTPASLAFAHSSVGEPKVLPPDVPPDSIGSHCYPPLLHRILRGTWWAGKDSNLRRHRRQIYSLLPLATRVPAHSLEPTRGIEPPTASLQVRCSTVELRRHKGAGLYL